MTASASDLALPRMKWHSEGRTLSVEEQKKKELARKKRKAAKKSRRRNR